MKPQPHFDASAEAILQQDPGGVYACSDWRTRSQHHAALAEWAGRARIEQAAIARIALSLAQSRYASRDRESPGAHVGHYLFGVGAPILEAGLQRHTGRRVSTRDRGIPPVLLPVLTIALCAFFVFSCVVFVRERGTSVLVQWLLAVTAIPVAFVYGCRLVRWMPWRRRRGLPLPRFASDYMQVDDCATLIVVPAMAHGPTRVRELLAHLQKLADAHPGAEYRFALLTDFSDAPCESLAADDEIVAELRAGITALNAATRGVSGDRFFGLQRRRTWSDTQGAWIGWERKRGKLQELMRLIQPKPSPTTFEWQFGDLPTLTSRTAIPFVISLDETSWLMPGGATLLVRTAQHPLNRPVIDDFGRVVSGYAVLQPSVRFALDTETAMRGAVPLVARSSFGFEVLDVATHVGAGALYHCDAYLRVIANAFPPEVVLHHDLLEGFAGRTGEVGDAMVLQPWPRTYLAQMQRGHRWLRGLLQATPFLLPTTRSVSGSLRRNPLTTLQQYVLVELLLRELSKAASLVLLCLAWTSLPGSPTLWTFLACPAALTLAAHLMHVSIGAVLELVGLHICKRWRLALGAAAAPLFSQIVLVQDSLLILDALARTSWRLLISRRHLLDWSSWRAIDQCENTSIAQYWRALCASPILGGLTVGALLVWRPSSLAAAAPFAVAWILAPLIVGMGDRYVFGGK